MNIWEEHNKWVTFDMMGGKEQMIDKLTVMMDKLVTDKEGQNRQFKLQVYQSIRGRGQARCNYEQRRFQDRFRSNNSYRGRPRYGQDYIGRSRYDSNYRGNYRNNMQGNHRYGRQNYNNTRRGTSGTKTMKLIVGHIIGKTEAITEGKTEVLVIVGLGQVQEQ